MKVTSRVVIKLQDVLSPIHEEFRGQVLLATLPNRAGRDRFGRECTSFKSPYLVHRTTFTGKHDLERFIKELKEKGFYYFETE